MNGSSSSMEMLSSGLPAAGGPQNSASLPGTCPASIWWDDRDEQDLIRKWNDTTVKLAEKTCVHRLFEEQAQQRPDALAVADGHRSLTYRELNEWANRVAERLRGAGVRPEVRVAVCLERSLELVVALLAVLKAGGAYLPIDPTHPLERIEFILKDAQVPVLLVPEASRVAWSERHPFFPVTSVESGTGEAGSSGTEISCSPSDVCTHNLAYVIYTSGSTGVPKGVEVEHASLLNLVRWHQNTYRVSEIDRATMVAAPAFDASTWELWPYLTAGASLHIPDEEVRRSPNRLLDWLMEQRITLAFVPTPLAEAMLDEPWPKTCSLRALLTGGDRLHRGAPKDLPCALVNHYGPTEITVVATATQVGETEAERMPSIGRPIWNTQLYVLDWRQQPVPIGVPGELYIGGAGVARSYLNRPELTAEHFIPNRFSSEPGARLYRSGDVVRWCWDGTLDFLGRTDDQVKIRGNRIDLGEIEAILRTHPAVREAAVTSWSDTAHSCALAAYVARRPGMTLDVEDLPPFLGRTLPDYMIPARFVFLDKLPLNSNGKIDRRSLPAPEWETDAAFVAPRSSTEQAVAAIWSQLLHHEQIGIHDNFFHLGGHSLLAAQVLSRVRRTLGVELMIGDLFKAPTLEAFAAAIDTAKAAEAPRAEELAGTKPAPAKNGNGHTSLPIIVHGAALNGATGPEANGNGNGNGKPSVSSERIPEQVGARNAEGRELSLAQERLWFLEQLEPGVPFNNVPLALRVRGNLNVDAFHRALEFVIQRHEPLRTRFQEGAGRPRAWADPIRCVPLAVFDLSSWPNEGRQAEAQRLMDLEARRPFDLTRSPLLRGQLIRLEAEDHLLLLVTHHIACDGWSMGIFHRELSFAYEAFMHGRSCSLPELAIGYSDFSSWQRRWVQGRVVEEQLAYWKKQLAGTPLTLALPTDRPRPAVQTYRGDIHWFRLPDPLSAQLNELSRTRNVTMFMLLLTAWQTLLHRYSGQEEILVGAPIAGRTRYETEDMIGIFLNLLVMRGNLSGAPRFSDLLQRVRDVALGAYQHQDLPFEKLVDALQPERDLSRSPLFQVMFVWHNQPAAPLELGSAKVEPLPVHNGTARFDLTLSLEPAGNGLAGFIEYNSDLYDAPTIVRMAGHFRTLLEGIVANPEQRVSALPFLTPEERTQLVRDWNNNHASIPSRCIHECFEEQVERSPDAIALVFEDEQLTYRELDGHANALAKKLHELGVGPDVRVGLCLERSLEMMIGLLGILKAGGAYLPLDPTYPQERLMFMVQDARVQVLLAQEKSQLPGLISGGEGAPAVIELKKTRDSNGISILKLISLSKESGGSRNAPQRFTPRSGVTPENLAYVIYTSGSTGKPKGVMVTHRNVVNFFAGMDQLLGCEPGVWLAVTSISFDISVLELFWTLARGYKVVLHNESTSARTASGPPEPTRITALPTSVPAASTFDSIGPSRFPARSPVIGGPGKSVAVVESTGRTAESRGMDFSLFYFASDATETGDGKYRLLLDGARFADRHNFTAVWTPERHFHAFGGLYPNPSVTAAALAMVTERIRIRGGSVVLPLHDVIRVAEEWAVVDNLSRGRVDISFASGWHANDFVLAPENHSERHAALFRQIDTVRRLWRGEPITRRNGAGQEVPVRILPRPVQAELPFWVTAAGSPETFRKAGELGANLLTHLLGQSIEELAAKITAYRAAWMQAGYPAGQGKVTLMLHTFVGGSDAEVRETVRRPFSEYLKTSLDLVAKNAGFDPKSLAPEDVDILIARVFDRYVDTSGLFGTPAVCRQRVEQLKAIGVDEIACLIDFGVAPEAVLDSLDLLNEVRERSNHPDILIGFPENEEHVLSTNGNGIAAPDVASERTSLREPRTIPEQIARHGVTHLQCTPSLAALLMQDPAAPGGLARLRKLMLGGEALPAALVRQIRENFTGELFNLYGPTETTIWSAGHILQDPSRPISIGRPIANTEMYIVDRNNELVPIGIPGELLIGGMGVARGYHERPQLTHERFIPHLFATDPSLRLYRTGDLVRYTADGEIEFLGRMDQQVKLRGHRIELGEIETLLSQHPAVSNAVVTSWGESPSEKRLVAYIVPRLEAAASPAGAGRRASGFDESEVRDFLKQQLPDYMVPAVFMTLDSLPLTANGKVDRRSLPPPDPSHVSKVNTGVPPSTQTEKAVADIWSEVLGRKDIGAHDNFFELGGHSLLIMQVIGRVREAFQVDLRIRALFDSPTLAEFAAAIEEGLLRDIHQLPEKEAVRLASP